MSQTKACRKPVCPRKCGGTHPSLSRDAADPTCRGATKRFTQRKILGFVISIGQESSLWCSRLDEGRLLDGGAPEHGQASQGCERRR